MKFKSIILVLCLLSSSVLANDHSVPSHIRSLQLDFPTNLSGIGVIPGTGITQWQRPGRSYDLFAPLIGRRSNTDAEYQLAMIVFGYDVATHVFRGKSHTGYYRDMFRNLKHAVNALLRYGARAGIGEGIVWYNPGNNHYGGLRVDDINISQSNLPCKKFSIVLHLGNKVERDTSIACYLNNRWFYNYRD